MAVGVSLFFSFPSVSVSLSMPANPFIPDAFLILQSGAKTVQDAPIAPIHRLGESQNYLLAGESNPALPRSGDGGFRHWQAGVGADETAILTDILARIDDGWQKHGSKNSIIVIIFFYRYFGMTDYIHEDFILMKPLHQWRPKSHFYSYSAPYWLVKLKADTRWSRWLHRA